MTTKPEQPPLSIEERVEKAARVIAVWAFHALPINLRQAILIDKECKFILRRHFGDLGGDYSCAVCGFGMKEPCEHWKKMLAASAESQSPAVNSIHEIRPFELPSCHICGAQMTPKTYKCESCGATTGVAPAESRPLRVSIPEGHTFSNVSINGAKVSDLDQTTAAAENISPTINAGGGIDRSRQSDPLCRLLECGKPRSDAIHVLKWNTGHAPQTRSGPGDQRKHEEELNPTGRRFRMKWWNWWDDSRINIRTGPPDRRRAQSKESEMSKLDGMPENPHRVWPYPNHSAAQLGKKEGEQPESGQKSKSVSATRAAGTSVTSAAPRCPECLSDSRQHGNLRECTNAWHSYVAQVTAPQQPQFRIVWRDYGSWQRWDVDVCVPGGGWKLYHAANATEVELSSLLAERDKTIARSDFYRMKEVNYRYCHDSITEIASVNQNVREYVEHWEGRAKNAEATAERLRGLLREAAENLAIRTFDTGSESAQLFVRIQKELEP